LETIAVYWEPRIKTYGFNSVNDLALLELASHPEQIADLGLGLQDLGDLEMRLFLVLAQHTGDQELRVYLLVEHQCEKTIIDHVHPIIGGNLGESIRVTSPVGLLYFQGPHFGDRYGIADSAFGALNRKSIPVLAAGCSASSIYLVLPQERLKESKALLTKAFELPS
jgi:hypothetical protein